MKITKQEALSIAKGLTLPPDRMEEIAIFCGQDGGAAMGMGRHGIYFALGDLLRQHPRLVDEGAHWPDGDTLDLAPYANTIASKTAFAALNKHLNKQTGRVRPIQPLTLTLLNTSIITAEGCHALRRISLAGAVEMVHTPEWVVNSAIGHEATAAILTELLGVQVPVNRQAYQSKPGDLALVFKLKGRPPEGKILSRQEMEEIGYEFFTLQHVSD